MEDAVQVSEIMEAVEGIGAEVRRLEKLKKVARLIERIGVLTQTENEIRSRLDQLLPQEAEARQVLAEVMTQIEAARKEAAEILSVAEARARRIAVEAKEQAEKTKNESQAKADEMIRAATARAEQARVEWEAQTQKAEAARKELSELESAIEKGRNTVRQMLS